MSGVPVSLNSDGSIVIIGATENDENGKNSGHVRVFKYINKKWSQLGNNIAGEAAGDAFGSNVCISSDGSIIAISARWNDGNGSTSGHVRIFRNSEKGWIQIGEDINGEHEFDQSGMSISLSSNGKAIAIGAHGNDDNGISSGHVRIFHLIDD